MVMAAQQRECPQCRWTVHIKMLDSLLCVQFSSVQSLIHVRLFVTPWTAARQASLSITNSRSLLKLMSIESVMPSSHLILCCPLLLLPSVFLSIRIFSKLIVNSQNRDQNLSHILAIITSYNFFCLKKLHLSPQS